MVAVSLEKVAVNNTDRNADPEPYLASDGIASTLWPSGLRRWLKAPFRKGVGSNPTGVIAMCCVQLSNVDTPVLLLRLGNTVMERSGDGERG